MNTSVNKRNKTKSEKSVYTGTESYDGTAAEKTLKETDEQRNKLTSVITFDTFPDIFRNEDTASAKKECF